MISRFPGVFFEVSFLCFRSPRFVFLSFVVGFVCQRFFQRCLLSSHPDVFDSPDIFSVPLMSRSDGAMMFTRHDFCSHGNLSKHK